MISGSFWSAFSARMGSSMPSGLDDLLERDSVTLEELLDHDEVIQECKYMNSQLIDHLTQKENLKKMIKFIVTVPELDKLKKIQNKENSSATTTSSTTTNNNDNNSENNNNSEENKSNNNNDSTTTAAAINESNDSDSSSSVDSSDSHDREKKYPFVSSELFACEVLTMLDVLFENNDLLDLLFSFLDYPAPMDPSYASYFRKVLVVLIQRKYDPLVKYIQSHGVIDQLVNHIGLYSIMELLIMIGWDDGLGQVNDVQWLYKENLIPKLVSKLSPEWEKHTDVHMNAARALVDVVVKCPPSQQNLLISHLQSTPVLQNIFSHMFSGCQSSLTNSMSIIIVLVQRFANRKVELGETQNSTDESELLEEPFSSLMPHLPRIIDLLRVPQPTMKLQFGSAEPFGENRMKVVELTLVLLRSRVQLVDESLSQLHVLKYMLEAFFNYPWNNMLHGLVESIIRTVLDSESPLLLNSLFKDGELVNKFISAYDAGEEKNTQYRAGYMGHLLRTSAAIEEICRKSDSERLQLLGDEETMKNWLDFVENKLAKENEKQKILLIEDGTDGLESLQDEMNMNNNNQSMGMNNGLSVFNNNNSGNDNNNEGNSNGGYSFKTVMMEDEDSENDDGENENSNGFEYETNGQPWRDQDQERTEIDGSDWADFSTSFPGDSQTAASSNSSDYSAALQSFNRPTNARSLIQFPVASEAEEGDADGDDGVVQEEPKKEEDFAVEFPAV